jgi:hypothetical protein
MMNRLLLGWHDKEKASDAGGDWGGVLDGMGSVWF